VVLGRTGSDADVNFWVQQISQHGNVDVASAFWLSSEHRGQQVDSYYQRYLKRAADAAGRQTWINAFLSGQSEVEVQIAFASSAEYSLQNSSNSAFVTALYRDVLGRTPDTNGQNFWLQTLNSGASRKSVATAFLTSVEYQNVVVEGDYRALLGRASDA